MYLQQGNRIAWPQYDISLPSKYLPLLERKAAHWKWMQLSFLWAKMTGKSYANQNGVARDLLKKYFEKIPEFATCTGFSKWLVLNGIQPSNEEPPHDHAAFSGKGLIYCLEFSEHDNLVKIGRSYENKFSNRLSQYSTSYPIHSLRQTYIRAVQFTPYETIKTDEKLLHERLQSSRIGNCEWFRVNDEVHNWINQCDPNALFQLHQTLPSKQQELFRPALF